MTRIFLKGPDGRRAVHGANPLYHEDPNWQDLILFYEYFHGDCGSGVGASHQTGWTGVVAKLLQQSGERVAEYDCVPVGADIPAAITPGRPAIPMSPYCADKCRRRLGNRKKYSPKSAESSKGTAPLARRSSQNEGLLAGAPGSD